MPRSSAPSLAIIVDALLGCVDVEHAACVLRIRPETLTRILQEIAAIRARRATAHQAVSSGMDPRAEEFLS
jgi:hypothetical protein